jgi:hypothetical protein
MSETDHIVKGLKINQKAQFNLINLYKTLKYWFEINGYSFFEKEYEEIVKKNKKDVIIKWIGSKTIDDYSKAIVRVKFKIKDYEIIETEKEKLVNGSLGISFESDIVTDYEERWEHRPIWKFLRGVFDKFLSEKRRELYEKELTEDTYDIFHRTKSFLNLYKFR